MTTDVRTFYVEAMTAAALMAEAERSGRAVTDVYREHLGEPTATIRIRVVNLDDRLRALVERGLPWDKALALAFQAA